MFTDIEGSTRLRTTLGDDRANVLHGVHDSVVEQCAREAAGTVVKGTGDGAMVSFTSARNALRCGMAIQRRLRDLSAARQVPRVRIGFHAGEVEVADDGDLFGQAVNGAARVASIGDGGEIVASDVVRGLVGSQPDLEFIERGSFELNGFSEPWVLHTIAWDDSMLSSRGIALLGDVAIYADGNRIEADATPRGLLVLAAAALSRGVPVDRAELAFRLWPDSTEQQARTNLRKVLHELRAWLPDDDAWLEVDPRRIRLRTEQVVVDVERFEDAAEREDIEAAVQLYGGDLLPGYWDDWVLAERQRLCNCAIDCLWRSLHKAQEAQDLEREVVLAHQLISFDPVDERAHQVLMRAHAALGNRAAAVRAFHQCASTLQRELGVEPVEETVALYEDIRCGGSASTAGGAPVDGRSTIGATDGPTGFRSATAVPMVGRTDELAWLDAVWRRAAAEGPRAALVTGDAGMGKSRLVEEHARRCERANITVLRARAYETDKGRTLGPVIDWLRHDRILAAGGQLGAGWRRELSRLLPELAQPADDSSAADPAEARSLLFEAATEALRSGGSPLLFVLDDIQWCGADTVDFVMHLLHRPPTPALLVAITRRDYEDSFDPELELKLAGLRGDGTLDDMALQALDCAATREIAAAVLGSELDEGAAARLHSDADGHPLFIIEAARAGLSADDRSLTAAMHGVIQRRLAQLGEGQRTLLEVAATIGRRFDVETLAAAVRREEDEVVDDLDHLWRHGILIESASGFDFSHDKVREVVSAGVSPVRSRQLHRRIARALSDRHAQDLTSVSADLATHYEAAGLDEEAIGALDRAAARASTIGAHREAISLLERALRLLQGLAPGDQRDQRELELLTELGAALVVCAGYGDPDAQRTWTRAAGLSRRLGTTLSAPVLRGLALSAIADCRFARAADFGEDLRALDDPLAVVEGEYVLGVTRFWLGEFGAAEHHLQCAIAAYDPARSPEHRRLFSQDPKAICMARLAFLRVLQGRGREALELLTGAERLASDLDDPLTASYVATYRDILDRELGQHVEDRSDASAVGGFFEASNRGFRAWAQAHRGDAAALAEVAEVVDLWRQDGHRLHLTLLLSMHAELLLDVDEIDSAEAALIEALRFTEARSQRYLEPELLRLHAQVHRARGSPAEAARLATRARERAKVMGARALELRALTELCRCGDGGAEPASLRALVDGLATVHLGRDLDEARQLLRTLS